MLGPAEVGDILLAQTNSTGAQGWLGRLWCLSPRGAYHLHGLRTKKKKKKRERKKEGTKGGKNDQHDLKRAFDGGED